MGEGGMQCSLSTRWVRGERCYAHIGEVDLMVNEGGRYGGEGVVREGDKSFWYVAAAHCWR
jgi:hypothetical protein